MNTFPIYIVYGGVTIMDFDNEKDFQYYVNLPEKFQIDFGDKRLLINKSECEVISCNEYNYLY